MFKCDKCNKVAGPAIHITKVVVKKRTKKYVDEITGIETVGWEIVKEDNYCPECASASSPKV